LEFRKGEKEGRAARNNKEGKEEKRERPAERNLIERPNYAPHIGRYAHQEGRKKKRELGSRS